MARESDLEETVRQVEALDRRIHAQKADVRDLGQLQEAVSAGEAALGPIDIILANAGIAPLGLDGDPVAPFRDVVDVNLTGVYNTVIAAVPSMIEKKAGAIVLTSSTQGLKGVGGNGSAGTTGYTAAKHGVVGLMRSFTHWLGPLGIRVNSVHPTGVATPMIQNPVIEKLFADFEGSMDAVTNIIPVPWVEPVDISNAIAFLVSDDARYITGVTLPVDAGFSAR